MLTKEIPTRLIAVLLITWGFSQGSGAQSPSVATAVDQLASQEVRSGKAVGLAVAILKNGKPLLLKGYGSENLEQGSDVSTQTVFRVGSLTKQFTAAGILLLVRDGKLSLDARLSQFLPDFPDSANVSLYQLLTHTSGIHDFTASPTFLQDCKMDRDGRQMIQYIEGHTPLYDFSPGTAWRYSNSGYYLLGLVIEKSSGMPLREFFKQRLFEPLGMHRTALDDNGDIVPHRAAGYDSVDGVPHTFRNAPYVSMTVPAAAGALRTTLEDLVKWNVALVAGKIVPPHYFQQMITPALLSDGKLASSNIFHRPPTLPDFEYGLGLHMQLYEGHQRIGHNGTIQGFEAEMDRFPNDGITVIVLSNTFDPKHKIATAVENAALGIDAPRVQ